MKCHVLSWSIAIRSDGLAVRSAPLPRFFRNSLRQTVLYTCVFLHAGLSARSRTAAPDRTTANRPPKKRICSYNVPIRRRQATFCRRLRPGSGSGIPLRKQQGPRRRPLFSPFFRFLEESASASEVPARSTGDGGVAPDRREAPRRKESGDAPIPPGLPFRRRGEIMGIMAAALPGRRRRSRMNIYPQRAETSVRRVRIAKGCGMTGRNPPALDDIFRTLDRWRHLPAYRLEPTLAPFFGSFPA